MDSLSIYLGIISLNALFSCKRCQQNCKKNPSELYLYIPVIRAVSLIMFAH